MKISPEFLLLTGEKQQTWQRSNGSIKEMFVKKKSQQMLADGEKAGAENEMWCTYRRI